MPRAMEDFTRSLRVDIVPGADTKSDQFQGTASNDTPGVVRFFRGVGHNATGDLGAVDLQRQG